jgi:trehalose 6-phosphate synthase/phosphatase
MQAMRHHLQRFTVDRWSEKFMGELQRPHTMKLARTRNLNDIREHSLLDAYQHASRRLLLLDYDGVLRSFVRDPAAATPSRELIAMLRRLGSNPANDVAIVSGRSKSNLQDWFGKLPIALAAEHGAYFRRKNGRNWHKVTASEPGWHRPVAVLLEHYADQTPGAFVEQKEWAIVWHYNSASTYYAQKHLVALRRALKPIVKEYSLQILEGHKVLEVRPSDVHKGRAAQEWLIHDYDFVLAIGDDTTDEDMFAALPPDGYSIKVGRGSTFARYRLPNVTSVLYLLEKL